MPAAIVRGMQIRPVRPAEHAAVGALLEQAYAPSGMAPDAAYWAQLRDTAGRTHDAEVWVAEVDGRILGTVTWAGAGSGQQEIAREGEAEFRMLGVAPQAQRHGVGAALLEAVVDRARQDGYRAVVLCSAEWMTSAHRLYERRGFHRIPERDWTPVPGINLLAYRLHL